jgi:hypothetical protein
MKPVREGKRKLTNGALGGDIIFMVFFIVYFFCPLHFSRSHRKGRIKAGRRP